MKSNQSSDHASLESYLRSAAAEGLGSSPSEFIAQGARFVTPEALGALRGLLPQVGSKARGIKDSDRLRQRLDLLALYAAEEPAKQGGSLQVEREVGFVLYYFLKGFDVIPDSIPDVGYVDDALLVETVLRRHEAELRAHWQRQGRAWPERW